MNLHQKITSSIHKIKTHWERAEHGNQSVSRIDRDILIEDIRMLYNLVFELEIDARSSGEKKDENLQDIQGKEEILEGKAEIPVKEKNFSKNTEKTQNEDRNEPKTQVPSEVALEIITDHSPNEEQVEENVLPEIESSEETTIPDEMPEEPAGKSDPEFKKSSFSKSPKSTSDQFHASLTLGDIYQKNGDNSLAAKIQKNKIADIKSAIGINDRFLFINEIFKGDAKKYKQAIESLNGFAHYHEALGFVENIQTENKVENKEAVNSLIEIIKRKFQ